MSALSRFVSSALIGLSLSFTLSASLLLGLTGAATAQSLRDHDDLDEIRASTLGAYSFLDLTGAGDQLSNNAYRLLFSQPYDTYDWNIIESGYRLLLALTLDADHDGRAALLAAAVARNAGRPDHARALAVEALDLLDSPRDINLAQTVLRLADNSGDETLSYDLEWQLRELAGAVSLFGPAKSWTAQQGDFAQLCLLFSRPLQAAHRVDYRELITLSLRPTVEHYVIRGNGRELCIVGTDFAETYDITIREGLKSASGTRMRESVTLSLQTPGRTPEVALPGQGYMLPASGSQLVALETVNHEQIRVGLYHLDERNIKQVLRDGLLAQTPGQISGGDAPYYDYGGGSGDAFRASVVPVFEGLIRVNMLEHELRRDGLALADMLGAPAERGLYLLTARAPDLRSGEQIKWVMVSDLGLTAVKTPQGLFVTAVDTRTGQPVFDGVSVDMITSGNRVISPATAIAKAAGAATTAFFSAPQLRGRDGNQPLYLYASHPTLGDAFLALERTPVEIETPRGLPAIKDSALDLWVKADRGTYREGETARVAGLLQVGTGPEGQAVIAPDSLTGTLRNPFGEVSGEFDISIDAGRGFEVEIPLPFGARQGRWTLDLALAADLPPLRSLTLPVSDFVPPSVEIEIVDPPALKLDGSDRIEVQVDYLFGAPAQDLSVHLMASLVPQAQIDGFTVGLAQEDFIFAAPFDLVEDTDDTGRVSFEIPAFTLPDQTGLALVDLRAVVTDAAGRQESTAATVKLAGERVLLGLRPAFDADQPVEEGAILRFDLQALIAGGEAAEASVSWTLYREVYDYRWYFDGGRWNYESSYIDLPVSEGRLDLIGETPLDVRVDWGAYRLEVVEDNGAAATSLRFNAGWRALPQVDRAPGRLGLVVEGDTPRPGDTLSLTLDSPQAGTGQLYMVGSKTAVIDLGAIAEGSNSLQATIPADWPDAEGLWLLPVVYSAGATGVDALPARAVGASFLGFDHSDHRIAVSVDLEDRAEVLPRQPLNVALDLGPLNPGEQAFALGWIIDDGVLRMTGYRDPDPLGHFLDPFDLPAELRDTFAALISSSGLEAAALEQGYDDALFAMRAMAPMAEMSLAMGLTTRIKETLALSTGVQALDAAAGGGSLSFDLPDFAGRGRLLTLVWTDQGRIGVGSQTLLIRDPVVADLFLPRFLAPGDEVDVRLLVSNTQDRVVTAELSLQLETGLDLVAGSNKLSLDLDPKAQQPVPLRLGATDVIGATKVIIDLTIGEQTIRREFPIEIRPAAPRSLVRDSFLLGPGETLNLDAGQLAALNHANLGLSVSGLGVDPLPLAQSLADYPFRCTEQTTSRAIGLLLGGDRLMERATLDFALNEALVTLQNRQGLDGIIGLWPGSASGDLFLQAYAADFLGLAKAEGIDGAAALHEAFVARLARGLEQAEDPYFETELSLRTEAYGLAILARAERPDVAAQRLLFDEMILHPGDDFAKAALAVAAHAVGDFSDRDALLASLLDLPGAIIEAAPMRLYDYGGVLRDQFAALALLVEGGLADTPGGEAFIAETLPAAIKALDGPYLSTQERAWALRLAHGLAVTAEPGTAPVLSLNDQPIAVGTAVALDPADIEGGLVISNQSAEGDTNEADGTPALATLWQSGTPADLDQPQSQGMEVQRTMFDLETLQPVTNPAPGQRVLVSLFGTVFEAQSLEYIAAELLPAGFEVEQVGLPDSVVQEWSEPGDCPLQEGEDAAEVERGDLIPTTQWLPGVCMIDGEPAFQTTDYDYGEARADRVLFGFFLERGSFALYYVMRRAQAGDVVQPGAYVEAMMRPAIHARGSAGRLN